MQLTSIIMLSALAFAGCVPPQQQQAGAPTGPVVAQSGGGPSCEGACTRAIACNLVTDDGTCPDQCRQLALDEQTLDQIEHGTCEQVAEIVKQHAQQQEQQQQPAPRGTGGGVICTAEGSYEVCDGEYCRTKPIESKGGGSNQQQAAAEARQQCSSHLTQMTIISQNGGRASIKQSCQVTGCR
jgi:hypothetical protein